MNKLAHRIRSLLPKSWRLYLWRVGEYFGLDLENPHQFPSPSGTLATLQQLGLQPSYCVDVGAYHGEWTLWFKRHFPSCHLLMVEAQESKRATLEDVKGSDPQTISLKIALLGPRENEAVTFHEMETGSSVFAEASNFARRSIEKHTRTLDGVLSEEKFPRVDFLKLDVQGYELEVLKGANRALADAEVVWLEASLVRINAGCPLVSDVIAFMAERGFQLFDFCSQTRRLDGVLWQTDLVFLRANSRLQPTAELTAKNWA